MNAPTVCDTCPHNQPSALAVLFSDDMIIQERIATFIDTKETTEEKVNALLICMTMMVFGKDNKKISRNTDWVVHQCLDAIWKLGNV